MWKRGLQKLNWKEWSLKFFICKWMKVPRVYEGLIRTGKGRAIQYTDQTLYFCCDVISLCVMHTNRLKIMNSFNFTSPRIFEWRRQSGYNFGTFDFQVDLHPNMDWYSKTHSWLKWELIRIKIIFVCHCDLFIFYFS